VRVVVDRVSSLSIPRGMVVDFVDEGGKGGFTFSAPEAALGPPDTSVTLAQARRGFKTTLARRSRAGSPPPRPPDGRLRPATYPPPECCASSSPPPRPASSPPT